ncbi:ABC transporter substrate-binding protein [Plesiomonas shigelloides]|uniref:extracellular solute-binding protein n=1 Tax=Plesiomonas shigelloides TaxID=703 RepID=UPI000D125BDB|nr:ABC transporter substrate-binding protein [Plesiomonas shigelloides]
MGLRQVCVAVLMTAAPLFTAHAQINEGYAFAAIGSPKYAAEFSYFDYVNPAAPKGGNVTLHAIGTFDNFNAYAQRGVPASDSSTLYDTLFTSSADEIQSYYPLIAEFARYPDDFSWMEVRINPNARFQDGKPIRADDVVFSFNKFMQQGVPQFKTYYQNVKTVEALTPLTVRFELKSPDRALLLSLIGGLQILPKHFWENRNLAEPLMTPPVGSGPYKITDYAMGQYVVYQRVADYWAANLPVNRGRYNFDTIRYDYYRDDTVALEAFKAGEYDFRQEYVAKYWATLYTGPNFTKGYIIRENIPHSIPQGMQALVFNTQNPLFKDRNVREALNLAFDFEWLNKTMFYNQYTRTRSFFQNTPYEAKGLPSEQELMVLMPFRQQVPEEVFTDEYQPSKTDGSGNNRPNLRKAMELLEQAGWEIRDRQLVNKETGQPFIFELLTYSSSNERIAAPLKQNLARLGITMNIRVVDTSQYINRLRKRDFDMIASGYAAAPFPSPDLKLAWHSKFLDSTYNLAGVTDHVIDTLTEEIDRAQSDPEKLLALGKVLDRVLQWNMFVIPQWHLSNFRVAYWNKFGKPAVRPAYGLGFDTWWVDINKAAKLPKARQ